MHTFQPLDIKDIDINPFNMIASDWFALTAEAEGKVNSMTAGWGGFGVMWGKNVAFIVVRDSRYTREIIDKADTFSMTFFRWVGLPSASKLMGMGFSLWKGSSTSVTRGEATVCPS